ncbi:MAG: hypothetical protein ACYC7E_15520 [Armatimonadota bacterium]
MKLWMWAVTGAFVLALAALIIGGVQAQGGPGGPGGQRGPGMGGPGGPGGPRPTLTVGAQGVFLLQGGILRKYDAKTLEEKGTLELCKADAGDRQGPGKGMRQGPGEMLLSNNNLLIVTGDTFYRVDAQKLKIEATGELPALPKLAQGGNAPNAGRQGATGNRNQGPGGPGQGPGGQGGAFGPPPAHPVLELQGGTLYVLRGPQLLAITIADGKVTAKAEVPVMQGPGGMGPGGQGPGGQMPPRK